ncbi:hypothetical protein OURE66S_03235 [Oligella ureolytica]|nr:hypothetical protein [Alcaligenaceae bacterium]HZJ96299.1 hypothetical protein [Oligella sp.]
MKLLTRLREEFTSVSYEPNGKKVKQEVEYVSEHAPDALVLMKMIEQRKNHNDVA